MISKLYGKLWKISGALFLVIALLALLQIPGVRPRDFFARHWRHKLSTSDDENTLDHLQKIAALDDAGIPILVESLGSPREVIVHGAHTVLLEELDRWQLWKVRHSTKRISLLSQCLADSINEMSPAGRRIAANLATRILHWPLDPESDLSVQVVSNCDSVFRSSLISSQVSSPVTLDTSRFKEAISGDDQVANYSRSLISTPELRTEELAVLPGGNLPFEIAKVTKAPTSPLLPTEVKRIEKDTPDPFFPEDHENTRPGTSTPRKLQPALPRLNPRRLNSSLESNPSSPAGIQASGSGTSIKKFRNPYLTSSSKKDYSDIEAMRLLHSDDSKLQRLAQEALMDRGFGVVQLELARQMFDPDPVVRRKLVEALPRIKSINTIHWLRWMLNDLDPEVRLAAVGIIGSTRDPKLTRNLRELRISETDPRVLEQLNRLLNVK